MNLVNSMGSNGVSIGLFFYNVKNIIVENGGHLDGWIRTQNATIDNIIFNDSSERGIQAVGRTHMKNVTFGHGGTMAQGIILNAGTAKIDNLTIQGAITGNPGGNWGGIHNTGTISNVNIQGKISDLDFSGGSVNNHNSGVKVAHLTMLALSQL